MSIDSSEVPFIAEAKGFAEMGMIPGGLHRNRDYRMNMIELGNDVPQYLSDILFDPQTSGGLLISVPALQAESLLGKMRQEGVDEAAIIGEIIAEPKGKIIVR